MICKGTQIVFRRNTLITRVWSWDKLKETNMKGLRVAMSDVSLLGNKKETLYEMTVISISNNF